MPNHGNNQFDKTYRLKYVNRQTSSWMHEIITLSFNFVCLSNTFLLNNYANKKTWKSGIVHFTLLLWCKLMNTLVITKKRQEIVFVN